MLHIVRSNRIETLADRLLEHHQSNPPADPFVKQPLVTQNKGTQQWLTLRMAGQRGIAAQVDFLFPAGFVYEIYKLYFLKETGLDEMPDPLPSDKEVMSWSIMRLLKERPGEFGKLTDFINRGEETDPALRRRQLSRTLADLFDQYLIYRPEMIFRWEQNKIATGEEEQARLWQYLVRFWSQNTSTRNLPHRAQLHKRTVNALRTNGFPTQQLPAAIPVFNLAAQPPIYWDLIAKLALHTEVWVYEQRPTQHSDWAKLPEQKDAGDEDLKERHLLDYLGDQGKTNAGLLENFIDENKLRRKQLVEVENHFEEPGAPGLLGAIQQDLMEPSDSAMQSDNDGKRIQLQSCHSPRRELEVLYDRLLDILERDPELKPSDIAVVTPDIEPYAPLIDAVFGAPDEGQPKLPYRIAGTGFGGAQVSDAFLTLLQLLDSRFKVTEVMDWIDREVVRRQFDFSSDDLEVLQQWLEQSRVRWGVDADDRRSEEQPAEELFTWQFGLDKLMLGYAMRPDEYRRFAERFPLDGIEGSDATELLGRFFTLMQQLFEARRWSRDEHAMEEWSEKLLQWVDQFLGSDRYENARSNLIREIQKLAETAAQVGFEEQVSLGLIRRWIQQRLDSGAAGGSVLSGRITFAPMVPMRSLPHQVIAVLGLNDADYPREDPAGTLDLIARHPKPGDRSRREEDHYLFLENLLSARRYLILSYLGSSDRDDSERPPSVILDEFQNYLERRFGYQLKPVKHRLQPFSKKYFDGDEELFTYSKQQETIRRAIDQGGEKEYDWPDVQIKDEEEESEVIQVDDLVSFWQHPAKYFAENRLDLRLRETELLSEDRDLFALDGLDRYQADQELLDGVLQKNRSISELKPVLKARGLLPAGWPGEQAFNSEAQQVEQFREALQAYLEDGFLEPVSTELQAGEIELAGRLKHLTPSRQLFYRLGDLRTKDRVETWIWHLVQQAAGYSDQSTLFVGWDKKKAKLDMLELDPAQNAHDQLEILTAGFREGRRRPIPFVPDTAYRFVEQVNGGKEEEDALNYAVGKGWEPSEYNYSAEGADLYNLRVWSDTLFTEHGGEFIQWARHIWQPFFEAKND